MNLVELKEKEPVTTTLVISEKTENDHSSVFKLVKAYQEDLSEFGVVGFEIRKPSGKKGGRPLEFAYLNEDQTMLIMTYMRNSEIVRTFKKSLVKEFRKMKNVLSQISSRQTNEEWKQLRESGKFTRKQETDVINQFLDYAISQGSEGYKKKENAFATFSKMENKALFIIQDKFPNIRQLLTGQQLQIISSADQIVEKALKEGMEKQMQYKDIYKLAKERIETFSEIIPKTIVPMLEVCIK